MTHVRERRDLQSKLVEISSLARWISGAVSPCLEAEAATQKMVRQRRPGKLVFISSTLGYMSFVGYNSYSPGKHALRALGDGLTSELMLYGIDVHTYFPATMYTAGYETENLTKPAITLKIESTDKGQTPEEAARCLYAGVVNGQSHIAGDWITEVLRASTRGVTRTNNWAWDFVLNLCSFVIAPVMRMVIDKQVVAHRQEHEEYLKAKNFFRGD